MRGRFFFYNRVHCSRLDVLKFDIGKGSLLSALPYLVMSIILQLAGFVVDWIRKNEILTTTQVRRTPCIYRRILSAARYKRAIIHSNTLFVHVYENVLKSKPSKLVLTSLELVSRYFFDELATIVAYWSRLKRSRETYGLGTRYNKSVKCIGICPSVRNSVIQHQFRIARDLIFEN